MSDERAAQRGGFFSRMFNAPEGDEETIIYSPEEVGMDEIENEATGEPRGAFTVERAADIIKHLPSDVSRESAVRIVRGTLQAVGKDIEALERSSRSRESKLNSEIDLSYERIEELKDKTDKVVQSLEEEIRKAREARDFGVGEEEDRISNARSGLEDVGLVREFFGLPDEDGSRQPFDPDSSHDTSSDEDTGDETQIMQRPDVDDVRTVRRTGPLAEDPSEQDTQNSGSSWDTTTGDTRENHGP